MANNALITMLTDSPKELVAQQTNEQKAQTYMALDILNKALKDEEKKALLASGIDTYSWTLANGKTYNLTIGHGATRKEDVVETTTDFDAVIKYAQEHNLEIPYTKPQIDVAKLESLGWFQDNCDKFVKKEIKTKTIKSNDRLVVKEC